MVIEPKKSLTVIAKVTHDCNMGVCIAIPAQMRNSFEEKTIGELCHQLKAECYTTMLQRARYVDKKYLEELGKELAYAM